MKAKVLTAIAVLMFLSSGMLNAQRFGRQGCFHGPGAQAGPPQEAIQYFEENILPVLKIQRQALDPSISDADKARINEIREELKTLRSNQQAHRQQMMESQEKPSVEERREMRTLRTRMHDLMDEAAEMAEHYDDAISAALEPVEDKVPEWRDDLMEICPYADDRPYNKGNRQGNRPGYGRGGRHMGGPGMHQPMMRHLMMPEFFLLWNPEEPLPFGRQVGLDSDEPQINLFPNPASSSVQVSIELEDEVKVELLILDSDGNPTGLTSETKAKAGLFTHTLNVESLNGGIYFVKINAGGESYIRRLVIRN